MKKEKISILMIIAIFVGLLLLGYYTSVEYKEVNATISYVNEKEARLFFSQEGLPELWGSYTINDSEWVDFAKKNDNEKVTCTVKIQRLPFGTKAVRLKNITEID